MPKQPTQRDDRSARAKPREKPQQIADELRRLIISGELDEGDSLGHEPELIERFGVPAVAAGGAAHPRGRGAHHGGARRAGRRAVTGPTSGSRRHRRALLQARNVSLADVFEAHTMVEPAAVRLVAGARNRRTAAKRLGALIGVEEEAIDDPGPSGRRTHGSTRSSCHGGQPDPQHRGRDAERGRRPAVTEVSQVDADGTDATRRRGVRSQERLASLIEAGDVDGAEEHWRTHMGVVGTASCSASRPRPSSTSSTTSEPS